MNPTPPTNPCGQHGIDFVELVSPEPQKLDALFKAFGFSKRMRHQSLPVDLYRQGDITFLVSRGLEGFAARFGKLHGPSICSMGWRVNDARTALAAAASRGAVAAAGDHARDGQPLSAVKGFGDSLMDLVEGFARADHRARLGFVPLESPENVVARGFTVIDHLTNNVAKGTVGRCSAASSGTRRAAACSTRPDAQRAPASTAPRCSASPGSDGGWPPACSTAPA